MDKNISNWENAEIIVLDDNKDEKTEINDARQEKGQQPLRRCTHIKKKNTNQYNEYVKENNAKYFKCGEYAVCEPRVETSDLCFH